MKTGFLGVLASKPFAAAKGPGLLLLLSLCFPFAVAAHQERLILAIESGKCTLRVEADDEERFLRIRILPESSDCFFSRESLQSLIREALSKTEPPRLEGTYFSLSIGRLVDFPWLCEDLALAAHQDPRWDSRRGQPRSMDVNRYVASLLLKKNVTDQFDKPLQSGGYMIASVTVEKVLVGSFADIPHYRGNIIAGKVPFDAIVWFRLKRQ